MVELVVSLSNNAKNSINSPKINKKQIKKTEKF